MSVYGRVEIEPEEDVTAGSMCSWKITYTVGRYGIDDGGSIIVVRKNICDRELPQFDDPQGSGYVTASTTGDAKLRLSFDDRYFYRPWFRALSVHVYDGSLREGDKITIVYGDRSLGGPGMRAQTFQEREHLFKVLVDPFRSRVYHEIDSPPLRVVGGPAEALQMVAPSDIFINRPFSILVRALDSWGNPSQSYRGTVRFEATDIVLGLPATYTFGVEDRGVKRFEGVRLGRSGVHRVTVKDDGGMVARSNPILGHERDGGLRLFWGDIHGQTHGESRGATSDTVGSGTPREYFEFARDVAAVDFCSWHGNDFQVSKDLWEDVCVETKSFHQPGRFVTFLGYEWSGNTPCGGDHNILYLKDDQTIHRSSHALVEDKSDVNTDRCPISELWKTFHGRGDVMAIPHVGGRYANFDFYDPEFIRLVEIHSFHGTFEWFAKEALRRGLRVGFVAGSDDHTCRPGLSYPPYKKDKTKGGLVAVYADALTRDGLWKGLGDRHCYGTTGARIILWVDVDGHIMGNEFTTDRPPKIHVRVHGTNHLHEVLVMRGLEEIYRHAIVKPGGEEDKAVKIMWSGARSKGRDKRTDWSGGLSINKGKIVSFEPFAFNMKAFDSISQASNQALTWRTATIGDYKGVVMKLDAPEDAVITFYSKPRTFSFNLRDLSEGPIVVEADGVDQRIMVTEISSRKGPKDVEFEYIDNEVKWGSNAYWVRVQQCDGEMAWSSPIFLNYERREACLQKRSGEEPTSSEPRSP